MGEKHGLRFVGSELDAYISFVLELMFSLSQLCNLVVVYYAKIGIFRVIFLGHTKDYKKGSH